ncbi:thioredoxin [Candidatus Parcubacteria bacterium]|nr:MAG: thioredoxin [Candidatus Parcubacteria bacterium]
MAEIHLTDENFEQEVLKNDKPVLVDFWAEWCHPCQMLGPVIEELAEEYEGKAKVGKLNVDENNSIPGNFGIMSIPTVMLFVNGEPKKTFVGVQSKETYKQSLDEAIS